MKLLNTNNVSIEENNNLIKNQQSIIYEENK